MPASAPDFVPPQFTASPDGDAVANDNVDLFGPAILRAERRLRDLAELTEIGMELTRALQRRVLAEAEAATVSTVINGEIDDSAKSPASKKPSSDPTEAFAKISRAVRLTINLETKADDALRALQSGQFLAREALRAERDRPKTVDELVKASTDARHRTYDRVETAIDRESLSEADYCGLMEAFGERLDNDEVYIGLEDRPLRETVERLCHDLGLSPDWSRWEGDDWIHDSPPWRAPYSIFNTPSRRPLLPHNDDGGPDAPDG